MKKTDFPNSCYESSAFTMKMRQFGGIIPLHSAQFCSDQQAFQILNICPLVDKLWNINTYFMAEGCFSYRLYFFNFNLSAVINADIDMLSTRADILVGLH